MRLESSDRDFTEIRSLQRQLRAVFESDKAEWPDADALQQIKRLCDSALLAIADDYCQEKICEVDRYAENLLSASRLRELIVGSLDAVDERLATLETLRRSDNLVARSKILLENFQNC